MTLRALKLCAIGGIFLYLQVRIYKKQTKPKKKKIENKQNKTKKKKM
jgi:alpha-acetolactate decarboxylase